MRRFQRYGFGASLSVLCAVSVSACATIEPKYATRPDLGPGQPRASAAPNGAGGTYKVGKPYQVRGQWYYPAEQPDYDETGIASWYGDAFNGKPTANGEIFDMNALSAAHKTLPLPSIVEVTNLDNGRSMQLRVNDRGPFVDNRIIDLSRGAAAELGVLRPGLARVRVRYVGRGDIPGQGRVTIARATPPPPAPVLPPPTPAAPLAPEPAPVVEMAKAEPTITQTELAPLEAQPQAAPPVVETAAEPVAPPVAEAPVQMAPAPAPSYRVQAGAFADLSNAERVATQLADAGVVEIQPMELNGTTLYRVMVRDIAGESEAGLVRDRVVQIGLADARILYPF
jgi:rare lipoprotein A